MVVYGDDALLRAALLETLHTPFSVIPGEPT
jgi:hypothetical protein